MKNVIRLFAVSSLFTLIGLNASAQEKKAGVVKAEKSSSTKVKVKTPVKAEKINPSTESTKKNSAPKFIAKDKFDQLPADKKKYILEHPEKYTVGK